MTKLLSLQVLEEAGDVTMASVPGVPSPVAILNDTTLSELVVLLRSGMAEAALLKQKHEVTALLELFDVLGRVLNVYEQTRNKFYAGPSGRVEAANVERELENIAKELARFHKR